MLCPIPMVISLIVTTSLKIVSIMKEKIIKAMQLIATEESYIRNGYSLNEEDAAALAEANDLLHEILCSVN